MTNTITIRFIEQKENNQKFDFFIDGIQLDKILGINRLSDMRFCDFDLDIFETDRKKFPEYDRKKTVKRKLEEFLLIEKPINQFQTDRTVLYRCHCGSDYCGVISFKIGFDEEYIYWKDIHFELDFETETDGIKSIEKLQFGKEQYIEEFRKFEAKYCA